MYIHLYNFMNELFSTIFYMLLSLLVRLQERIFICFLVPRYEKMISGMYMGEIVRLALEKLRKHGLLFGGKGSEELSTRGRFYTKYVSEIERFVHLFKLQSVKCTFLAIFNFFKDLKFMYWLKIYTKIHEIVSVCEDFPLFLFQ